MEGACRILCVKGRRLVLQLHNKCYFRITIIKMSLTLELTKSSFLDVNGQRSKLSEHNFTYKVDIPFLL